MKVTVNFDSYELALLSLARRELTTLAKKKGEKPPKLADVVKGAVRVGVHTIFGEDCAASELVESIQRTELAGKTIDPSQFEG